MHEMIIVVVQSVCLSVCHALILEINGKLTIELVTNLLRTDLNRLLIYQNKQRNHLKNITQNLDNPLPLPRAAVSPR